MDNQASCLKVICHEYAMSRFAEMRLFQNFVRSMEAVRREYKVKYDPCVARKLRQAFRNRDNFCTSVKYLEHRAGTRRSVSENDKTES